MLFLKGALSGVRQFLTTERPLKLMKNVFYFTSKALSVLKILSFCLDFLVVYQNGLIKKVNFKFYDVTARLANYCNTHTAQYLEK